MSDADAMSGPGATPGPDPMRSAPPLEQRDPAHPDYGRWKLGADAAFERGTLARMHLAQRRVLHGLRVLDLGCGSGSAALALAEAGCAVTAADASPARLGVFPDGRSIALAAADGLRLPFSDACFDAVVLQDVIEHVPSAVRLLAECARVLGAGGLLYLSTPNRESVVNYFSDPHWGLPRVARLRGEELRRALAARRPGEAGRADLACLLSQSELLEALESAGFRAEFLQRATSRMLFEHPAAVVWSSGHLRAVAVAERLGLRHLLPRLVSDRPGFVNRWLAPAWYVMAVKRR